MELGLAVGIFVIVVRDLSYLASNREGVWCIRWLDTGLRGDLGFHIWGFICGEASLFLSDVAWLWVFLTSRGQSDKRYSWGT